METIKASSTREATNNLLDEKGERRTTNIPILLIKED